MDPKHIDPKRIVAEGYDRIAEQYCAWASQVRREERAKYTSLLLDKLPAGAAVLELGCGAGLPTTRQLAQHCAVTGVDISTRQVALARHNVPTATFLHADMTHLDFGPASFDAVAAFYSLLHVPHHEQPDLLRHIAAWLRPGGILVATLWPHGAEATFVDDWLGAPMYWSGFDRATTTRLIAEVGLYLLSAEEETCEEFDAPITFLWVIAEKPVEAREKEKRMAEQTAQYDHIGSKYDEYAQTAALKRAEKYTFFRLVGALTGKNVLDLACGFGFYTRQLKQRGAAQVVGVDISPEMVRLARAKVSEAPDGVEYRVGDATHLPPIGRFDLVTAVYLLNYATNKEQLLGMSQSAYDNLVAGGRFVAYTMDPAFTLAKPNYTKYGVTVLRQAPEEDRYVCDAEFVTKPPTPFQYSQWSQATYEWAIMAAGFSSCTWHRTEVAPEDVARYGEAYWQDLYTNGFIIGLVCQK